MFDRISAFEGANYEAREIPIPAELHHVTRHERFLCGASRSHPTHH